MTSDDPDRTPDATGPRSDAHDHDVVIVGGGPAGCSAAVFTARDGLDTVVFDRGRSSIRRCAHLENYLGFPAGVDAETLYDLMHEQAAVAGATIVDDLVESVDRAPATDGFVVTLADGESVTASRVVAATRYDGEYLYGLDDPGAMVEVNEYDSEAQERFDRDYADDDGTTPVDGLYVASPASETDYQAILAAGRGARVGRRVVADARIDDGWWAAVAEGVDWVRRRAELDDEWDARERWVEWFDDRYADAAPIDTDSPRYERVRAAAIEAARSSYIDPATMESRAMRGHERLAAHLDPEAIVAARDDEVLLEAIDDEAIARYLEDGTRPVEASR
jgi:NADPH-dependent 2,4-dienoyl-CoA reductase/sulfur reductase-like enzyme